MKSALAVILFLVIPTVLITAESQPTSKADAAKQIQIAKLKSATSS